MWWEKNIIDDGLSFTYKKVLRIFTQNIYQNFMTI